MVSVPPVAECVFRMSANAMGLAMGIATGLE
jgi:hypothetical protein